MIDNPDVLHIAVVHRIDVRPGAIPDKANYKDKTDEEPREQFGQNKQPDARLVLLVKCLVVHGGLFLGGSRI